MRLVPQIVLLLFCGSIPQGIGFCPSRSLLRPRTTNIRLRSSSRLRVASESTRNSSYGFPENVDESDCPKGYFLDSVHQSCTPLGPLGRLSQAVENFGPFQKVSKSITNLFGMDTKQISKLGIGFALSYTIISNINGSITLSMAWYLSCKRTGLSPLAPGQWKSLLAAYGTIYAAIQLLRPFRVAAAVAMSKLSKEFLDTTQEKLSCSRTVSIAIQYALGWVAWACLATVGVIAASVLSGVPIR